MGYILGLIKILRLLILRFLQSYCFEGYFPQVLLDFANQNRRF